MIRSVMQKQGRKVMTVGCPKCGAQPGHQCVYSANRNMPTSKSHLERCQAAKKACGESRKDSNEVWAVSL